MRELPTKIIKLKITDYDQLSLDELEQRLDYFSAKLDNAQKKINDHFSKMNLKSYYSVIMNVYYIVETVERIYPDMTDMVNHEKAIINLKKKIGIL